MEINKKINISDILKIAGVIVLIAGTWSAINSSVDNHDKDIQANKVTLAKLQELQNKTTVSVNELATILSIKLPQYDKRLDQIDDLLRKNYKN